MSRALTLLSAIALFQAGAVVAQTRLQIPENAFPAEIPAKILNQKLRQIERITMPNPGAHKATASGERVNAAVQYDFSALSPVVDSLKMSYSQGRGSAFNFMSLDYDLNNTLDNPDPTQYEIGYVSFDQLQDQLSNGAIVNRRTYDAAGRVTVEETDSSKNWFVYDGSGRILKSTYAQYNSGNASWDTLVRDFYIYDGSGKLLRDSGELWDPTIPGWEPFIQVSYNYNGAGKVTTALVDYPIGVGMYITIVELNLSYTPGTANATKLVTHVVNFNTFELEPNAKDSLEFDGQMLIAGDRYVWNTTDLEWNLLKTERRHLNANHLPDSVHYTIWESGTASDSGYFKMSYNGQNNPLSRIEYRKNSTVPATGARWQYESMDPARIDARKAARLDFYPNPAGEKLHLKGLSAGSYTICNSTGQLVQSGRILNDQTVPVESLVPGFYLLFVENGTTIYQANFIRK